MDYMEDEREIARFEDEGGTSISRYASKKLGIIRPRPSEVKKVVGPIGGIYYGIDSEGDYCKGERTRPDWMVECGEIKWAYVDKTDIPKEAVENMDISE